MPLPLQCHFTVKTTFPVIIRPGQAAVGLMHTRGLELICKQNFSMDKIFSFSPWSSTSLNTKPIQAVLVLQAETKQSVKHQRTVGKMMHKDALLELIFRATS